MVFYMKMVFFCFDANIYVAHIKISIINENQYTYLPTKKTDFYRFLFFLNVVFLLHLSSKSIKVFFCAAE